LFTNDPAHKVVKLVVTGSVKPVPDFVRRIVSADIARGDRIENLQVWPTARPIVALEPGEEFAFGLRIRPVDGANPRIELAGAESERAGFALRKAPNGNDYWLDITTKPTTTAGEQTDKISLRVSGASAGALKLYLTTRIAEHNLIAAPPALDLGEVSLRDLQDGAGAHGRLSVRKAVGSFRIKSISSSLGFLSFEIVPQIEGRNYLIRVSIASDKPPKPGVHDGVITIETDDHLTPRVEAKVKVSVVSP
jgi:hypothetical protein